MDTTSGKNLEFVKSLGADHAINYQDEDFEKRVNNLDVVFDTLGGHVASCFFGHVLATWKFQKGGRAAGWRSIVEFANH